MTISAEEKVSSFLYLLQQVSLTHQLSLLQHEVEILQGQEARIVEIAENSLLLANSNHGADDFSTTASDLPSDPKHATV